MFSSTYIQKTKAFLFFIPEKRRQIGFQTKISVTHRFRCFTSCQPHPFYPRKIVRITTSIKSIVNGERSEPLSRMFNDQPRDIYIYYIPPPLTVYFSMTRRVRYQPILEKWFPLWGERAHSLKLFCMYDKRFEI